MSKYKLLFRKKKSRGRPSKNAGPETYTAEDFAVSVGLFEDWLKEQKIADRYQLDASNDGYLVVESNSDDVAKLKKYRYLLSLESLAAATV